MRLALFAPEWDRPCSVCKEYVFQDNGLLARTAGGDLIKRPADVPTPCLKCPKVPAHEKTATRTWKELQPLAVEMSAENAAAYRFYKECRATLAFPDDDLTRWYAGIIRGVEDERDRSLVQRQTAANETLAKIMEYFLRSRR